MLPTQAEGDGPSATIDVNERAMLRAVRAGRSVTESTSSAPVRRIDAAIDTRRRPRAATAVSAADGDPGAGGQLPVEQQQARSTVAVPNR